MTFPRLRFNARDYDHTRAHKPHIHNKHTLRDHDLLCLIFSNTILIKILRFPSFLSFFFFFERRRKNVIKIWSIRSISLTRYDKFVFKTRRTTTRYGVSRVTEISRRFISRYDIKPVSGACALWLLSNERIECFVPIGPVPKRDDQSQLVTALFIAANSFAIFRCLQRSACYI